jgi:hypothetical protein
MSKDPTYRILDTLLALWALLDAAAGRSSKR